MAWLFSLFKYIAIYSAVSNVDWVILLLKPPSWSGLELQTVNKVRNGETTLLKLTDSYYNQECFLAIC